MDVPTHYAALSAYLKEHVEAEEHALNAYEALLDGRPEDAASYLIRLILQDEERHHQLFLDMHETLESRMQSRKSDSPVLTPTIEGDVEALLAATEQLLRFEKQDARELRRLSRAWRRQPGERRLWALLVDTARLDTKKHILILRHLRALLRQRGPYGRSTGREQWLH